MIDTGATTTHLHKSLARNLGLKFVDKERAVDVNTGRTVDAPVYRIRITITTPDGSDVEWTVDAPEREYDPGFVRSFRIIIGNDILADCRLTYDGTAGSEITWPDGTVAPVGWFALEQPDRP